MTTPPPRAGRRLATFSRMIWLVGLLIVGVIAVSVIRALPDSTTARGHDYTYDPWNNPAPSVAKSEADGVFSGGDGAMIRLDDLDPALPVTVEVLDRTYVSDIYVTGPGGRPAGTGNSGVPVFGEQDYASSTYYLLVPGPSAELWIDGLRDDPWRVRVAQPALPSASAVTSGIGPKAVRYTGPATTARVSGRGDGHLSLVAITRGGSERILSEDGRFDRSVAWEDSDPVVLMVDAWRDKGWSIAFDEPDPSQSPTLDPAVPPATGGGADG